MDLKNRLFGLANINIDKKSGAEISTTLNSQLWSNYLKPSGQGDPSFDSIATLPVSPSEFNH